MFFVPISFLKNNGAEWSGSGAATAIKVLAVPQHTVLPLAGVVGDTFI